MLARVPVKSSMIVSIGYNHDAQVMEVEFVPKTTKDAPVYRYTNVPVDVYDELVSRSGTEDSVGEWFAANVRNVFKFERL